MSERSDLYLTSEIEKKVLSSVYRSLEEILGESGKRVILYHIENQHELVVDEIVQKPREFADALERIFGVGARIIEVDIIKNVYRDFGLDYREDKGFDFAQHLREAIAQKKSRNLV